MTEPFRAPLLILSGLAGLVLLIACTNVANMLLARATARRRELAVRCSVGAGRARLIAQMLAESLLLASAGGAAGLIAAEWCSRILTDFLPQTHIRLVLDLRPDGRALLFTSILSVLTGILFGLAPALQATRADLAATRSPARGDSRSLLRRWSHVPSCRNRAIPHQTSAAS